jgi:hypothetical protein
VLNSASLLDERQLKSIVKKLKKIVGAEVFYFILYLYANYKPSIKQGFRISELE